MKELRRTGRTSCPVLPLQQLGLDLTAAAPHSQLVRTRSQWSIDGPLDRNLVIRCVHEIVARHSILRTTFRDVDGRSHQQILADTPAVEVEVADLSALPDDVQRARWSAIASRIVAATFDLETGPLLRAALAVLGPDRHHLMIVIHHVAFDAASVPALFSELRAGYRALSIGDPRERAAAWPEPRLQFIDLAAFVDRLARSPLGRAQRAFWDRQLAGAQALSLAVDLPRARVDQLRDLAPRGIAAFEVGEVSVEIPTGVRASLAELGRQERATPYMVLLAGFTAMLSRATGQRDVCVQSTFSLRGRSELHGMIGFVGNALIQRVDNSGNPSFRELVRRTRQVVLASWGHGESLKIDRVDHSLRRVNFNYVPIESRAYEPVELAPGTFATRLDAPADSTQVRIPWDLHLWLLDSRSSTTLRLLFLRQLFLPRTARTLLEGYVELLGEMADRPDALVHGGLR